MDNGHEYADEKEFILPPYLGIIVNEIDDYNDYSLSTTPLVMDSNLEKIEPYNPKVDDISDEELDYIATFIGRNKKMFRMKN